MKKTAFFAPILVVLFGHACTNEKIDFVDDGFYWGTARAEQNGKPWFEAKPHAIFLHDTALAIGCNIFNSQGFARNTMEFQNIPRKLGSFELIPLLPYKSSSLLKVGFVSLLDDGDVLGYLYRIDTTSVENHFEVVFYEENPSPEIKILFSLNLINSEDETDTIRIRDGFIHTKVTR